MFFIIIILHTKNDICCKLIKSHVYRFHYMAIANDRQRVMPTAQDRSRGQRLDYDEAVLITNPSNLEVKGEVAPFLF